MTGSFALVLAHYAPQRLPTNFGELSPSKLHNVRVRSTAASYRRS